MPTLHRFDGYRVFVPANDHRPAHVHVVKAGQQAVFFLNCPAGPVTIRENNGFKASQLAAIERELDPIVRRLCTAWESIHGEP